MRQVLYALVPGTLAYAWLYGPGVIAQIAIACLFAAASEALALWLRSRSLKFTLADNSALVTGWLLALCLPPYAPWWLAASGAVIAILIAKHSFGGLGYNLFNPAMVGYAALLISFPLPMTSWPLEAGGFAEMLAIFGLNDLVPDQMTGATVLDYTRNELRMDKALAAIQASETYNAMPHLAMTAIQGLWLAGGLWLLWRRIINWHIPLSVLATLALFAAVFWFIDGQSHASPLFHLSTGAAILGAFFICTDPVSAAASNGGRLIYGAGIGMLIYLIRSWGSYPEAVAFAVLLMNATVPLIDYYYRPRAFGQA